MDYSAVSILKQHQLCVLIYRPNLHVTDVENIVDKNSNIDSMCLLKFADGELIFLTKI